MYSGEYDGVFFLGLAAEKNEIKRRYDSEIACSRESKYNVASE